MHSSLETALSFAAGLLFGVVLVFFVKRRRKESK